MGEKLMTDGAQLPEETKKKSALARFAPLAIVIAALIAFFALGLDQYFSLAALKEHRATLTAFVADNWILAYLLFMLVYAAAVAISFPGAGFLSIFGGFLFGWLAGGIAITLAATAGATVIFLIAKTSLGEPLRARAGPWMRPLEEGFRKDGFNYLLAIRLIPAFPFWVINLVPAFLGMRTGPYALATFLGIIPGVFVYASLGNGIGAAIDAGQDIDFGIILKPEILLPLIGLALLALLPTVVKKLRARRQ